MMAELLGLDANAADIVARHVSATGCHVPAGFVPRTAGPARPARSQRRWRCDEMMCVCQTASDEVATLALGS
jgi:hypothetical protein